jgi:SH3 domain protein
VRALNPNTPFISITLAFLTTCLLAPQLFAQDTDSPATAAPLNEPRYVSDILYVPLRSGSSSKNRIVHKGLKSGTTITLLEEADGWAKVKTQRNLEGWIQSRYLLKSPTAGIKLAQAQQKIEKLTTKAGPLGEKLLTSEALVKTLQADIDALEQEKNRQNKELERIKALSANQIRLDQDNKTLFQDNESLRNEVDTLKAENNSLSTRLLSNDIMFGAFAVFLGLIATLGIQHVTRSRKRSEWG